MCMHEDKYCPRCGIAFECKMGNITQCQCYDIALNNEELQYITKQFTDCLCFNCIKSLRTEFNTEKFATQIKKYHGH
ncbi:MAG: cysteine-rich CWC family protein [Ferruginibacter sp.]